MQQVLQSTGETLISGVTPQGQIQVAHFGQFEVDVASNKLKKEGIRLPLRTKSFELLTLLLQRPGEIITREELRQQLWPADGLSNPDNSLNAAVGRLRGVLGDSVGTAKYIETLPGCGYRFVGQLSPASSGLEHRGERSLKAGRPQ